MNTYITYNTPRTHTPRTHTPRIHTPRIHTSRIHKQRRDEEPCDFQYDVCLDCLLIWPHDNKTPSVKDKFEKFLLVKPHWVSAPLCPILHCSPLHPPNEIRFCLNIMGFYFVLYLTNRLHSDY